MIVLTDDQNAAVTEHVKWCLVTISENRDEIAECEAALRESDEADAQLVNMISVRIDKLKKQNQVLDQFLQRVAPPEPQPVRADIRKPNPRKH